MPVSSNVPRGLTLTAAPPTEDATAVRAWARSRGVPVDESGVLPPAVLHTYRLVHRPVLRLSA